MTHADNQLLSGFLEQHRTGKRRAVSFVPAASGFLRLEHDEDGNLALISFVMKKRKAEKAIGPRLELSIAPAPSPDDVVTLIEENGVSGLQWKYGRVVWGHTYEDDGPAAEGRKVALGRWIDECVASLVDPSAEDLERYREQCAARAASRAPTKIVAAIAKATLDNDPVWELPSAPYSSQAIVAALLDGIRSPAWRVRMSCAEALGLSRVEQPRIARALTALVRDDAESSVREHAIEALGELGAAASAAVPSILRRLEQEQLPPHLCVEALTKIPSNEPGLVDFYRRLIPPCATRGAGNSVDVPANAVHAVRALGKLQAAGARDLDLPAAFAPLSKIDPEAGFDVFEVMAAAAHTLLRQVSAQAATDFLRPFVARMRKQHGEYWREICRERLLDRFGARADAVLEALARP